MQLPARLPRAVWLVLAAALASGALLVAALVLLHGEAVRNGEHLTVTLSELIAEQTTRTLQSVDARLEVAAVQLAMMEQDGTLDADTARAVLRGQLKELGQVHAIWVVDTQGRIVFDTQDGNIGRSLAAREYFQIYQRAPATGFFVGPLVRSHSRGSWLMSASRPLHARDGTWQGVITASIEPSYVEQPWRGIDLGESGAVVLYHRSGQLLARSPADEAQKGQNFSAAPLFSQHLPVASAGMFVGRSPQDGVRRVVSYRVLPIYPQLVVAVGSGADEMLAPWRHFALLAAGVWAAAVLSAAGLTFQLQRQARRGERSERRLRNLAQAMPQVVFTADARGDLQFVNRRWAELTGMPVEAALGSGWRTLLHPDDMEAMREHLARMVRTGAELQHEARLRYRDGGYRWQLLRAAPVREGPSPELAWYGTATDIDDLKRAQARLQAQAQLLKIAGRLARMGGWTVNLATQRITWSEEAAAILDLPADSQPTLREVSAMFTPASLAVTMPLVQACMDEGRPFDVEVEMFTATGRRLWIRSIGEPVRDAEGKVVAMQGAQQDITQRVRLVEEIRTLNATLEEKIAQRTAELARQEALFRTLAQQAPLPFWTVDPQGAVTFLSRAWYELAGGAPPRWHGFEWLQQMHPDDLPSVLHQWEESARTGEPFTGTRRIRAADGSYHTFTYRAVAVRGEGGEILFWVGVDTDITDIMANESALRLANEQLEAFAYSVSHDLQSPLQRIQSFAKLLQGELAGESARARHYLERIRGNADTMAQLIDGLLALAQVSEMDMIRSVANLSDMATEILQRLQADHPQARVAWRVQAGMTVSADVRLMRSVLENLVGNAWKFTAGKAGAEIVVGSAQRGEYFVRDNGAGFDMAYADRLFGTFQRLHDPGVFPGRGIGLATVARAITRQGGRVWGEGAPGAGATFYFSLPPA
jgi:PAS domain S-box-containing protein